VIFTSDHGLAMGSHGLRGKQNMYEQTIGVPLVFAGPGIPRGRRSAAQCYLRDLYPTVCDLVGVKTPTSVEGRSLGPVLRGEADSVRPAVFGCFRDCQRMIRTDRFKLIHYPKIGRWQLFDLSRDPHELNDLAASRFHREMLADLRSKLESRQRTSGDPLGRGP
jgi:arylsulfatase A-like enzyme